VARGCKIVSHLLFLLLFVAYHYSQKTGHMSVTRRTQEEQVNAIKCARYTKYGLVCTGKKGVTCTPCKDHDKGCEDVTHRRRGKSFLVLASSLLMHIC
jgi:hypothetical protein